jgi:predicted acyl esterase
MTTLTTVAPELERMLLSGTDVPSRYDASEIRPQTVRVTMRDGVHLATDLYLPPVARAPAIALRTPYGRETYRDTFLALAGQGYVVVSQDCRGTGESEPDYWDFSIYEREDSLDLVEWITAQAWFDGFVGSFGASYVGGTQWCMAMHPAMSTVVPQVAGLGVAPMTRPHFHMFSNAYARSVGKGPHKVSIGYDEMERRMVDETLASGYFNQPLYLPLAAALLERHLDLRSLPPARAQRRLYEYYCCLPPRQRAELIKVALGTEDITVVEMEAAHAIFGHQVPIDAHMLPCPPTSKLFQSLQAPALMITGWYDWCLDDALATWKLLMHEARESVRSRSRLLITPNAHNMPGYREGRATHHELDRVYRATEILDLLVRWYAAVREETLDSWPVVIYYLMGANEWHTAASWPPPEAVTCALYLGPGGALATAPPQDSSDPDRYTYDPEDPTPTVGGSIVSYVYTPGSVDVSAVQQRPDVLTYTTEPLDHDLDVVGPLQLLLYASSSAVDTDFTARLSDVFPDGRAIQLQSVTLRARYRNRDGDPELLEPGRIYRFEIDMWATANRFAAGHRLRLDLSSADFPKFDRHTNRGGEAGAPISAEQSIYHDPNHPSHLLLSIVGHSDVELTGKPS